MPKKPYYKQSKAILNLIKKSKQILVNCHRSPDLDSVGSALAMREVLIRIGKKVTLVCPSELPERYYFLKNAKQIRIQRISDINTKRFDLFVSIDTASVAQLTGNIDGVQPLIPTIVIDHHDGSSLSGLVRLIDTSQYSSAEMLYKIFLDWDVGIDNKIATYLFAGIAGDTVLFSAPQYPVSSMETATELIRLGADKSGIIQHIFRNYHKDTLKTLGFLLQSTRFDSRHKIAYVVISQSVEKRMPSFSDAKEAFADLFFSSIEGVEVGVFFLEADGFVKIGFRSRGVFDCGKFVRQFNGGGHPAAAGAFVKGSLNSVVRNVLAAVRKQMQTMKSSKK